MAKYYLPLEDEINTKVKNDIFINGTTKEGLRCNIKGHLSHSTVTTSTETEKINKYRNLNKLNIENDILTIPPSARIISDALASDLFFT